MNHYALRLAVAVLTFAFGVIAATPLFLDRVPPAAVSPPPMTVVDAAGQSSESAARPVLRARRPFSRRVVGYVTDGDYRPVAGAEVCANPHGPVVGIIPLGVSESDGSFALDVWWPGTYTISIEHIAEGYPDATSGFYGKFFGELPVITVGESNELKPVVVRVGPKAGRVVFKIVDDRNGRPVRGGLVEVCRTDNPRMCIGRSTAFPRGRYEMLTPEVAFTIKFSVWGKDWEGRQAVDEDDMPLELLRVDLGARQEVQVRLRRVTGAR